MYPEPPKNADHLPRRGSVMDLSVRGNRIAKRERRKARRKLDKAAILDSLEG